MKPTQSPQLPDLPTAPPPAHLVAQAKKKLTEGKGPQLPVLPPVPVYPYPDRVRVG